MIHVQHLLGIGHLRRSAQLAATLASHGFSTHLVSGGNAVADLPIGGATLHQLPALRASDATFSNLIDETGAPVNEGWIASRSKRLQQLFCTLNPDVLITETFPFGRRMLRHELLPLLEAARIRPSRPLVVSSVRDILQPKTKPGRNREVLGWLDAFYDRVLIHGDPSISRLDDTFPYAADISSKCAYSGYIVDDVAPDQSPEGTGEVVVSGGGGAVSLPLLRAALDGRPYSLLNDRTWRLLVGQNIDERNFRALRESAVPGVIVERNRSDFFTLLCNCRLSVSQAGYNTVMDVLRSGARSLLIPFTEAGEVEQELRAEALQKCGRLHVLPERELNPNTLAQAIDRAAVAEFNTVAFSMNGAEESARLIATWLDERREG